MTITEFLLARITEDEAVARVALDDQRSVPAGATIFHVSALKLISRYDPARMLAECAAKRAIVELVDNYDGDDWGLPLKLPEVLAAIYADHPDYLQEWKL